MALIEVTRHAWGHGDFLSVNSAQGGHVCYRKRESLCKGTPGVSTWGASSVSTLAPLSSSMPCPCPPLPTSAPFLSFNPALLWGNTNCLKADYFDHLLGLQVTLILRHVIVWSLKCGFLGGPPITNLPQVWAHLCPDLLQVERRAGLKEEEALGRLSFLLPLQPGRVPLCCSPSFVHTPLHHRCTDREQTSCLYCLLLLG